MKYKIKNYADLNSANKDIQNKIVEVSKKNPGFEFELVLTRKRVDSNTKAIHSEISGLTKHLNDRNISVQDLLRNATSRAWTPLLAKELIWLPVQKNLGIDSTKDVDSESFNKIKRIIHKYLDSH